MTELICIVCPRGCRLHVDEKNGYAVTGNGCERGMEYGKNEAQHPVRILTSTVIVAGGTARRCPVKLDRAIPKGMIFEAMKTLDGLEVAAPVARGQIVAPDVCGSGANFVATRAVERAED